MSKLPEGWRIVNLEDIVKKMQSGGTPKSTNEDYYKGEIPFVKINDITSCNKYLTSTKNAISEEALNSSSAWLVPENSILYSMYASIGFLAINKIPVATNQAIMNLIPNNSKITLEYLYQYLLDLKDKIDKFVDQTTQKNLNAQKVKKFKIPLPPLEEQKKIAEILSTVDQKIASVDSQIEETIFLKKGLMQKLFTEGIGHSEFKESTVGRIPVEWEVSELGDLLTFKNGINASKEQYGQGYKFINVLDIINNLTINHNDIIGKVDISESEFSLYEVKYGDILFQRSSETREEVGQANVYLDKNRSAVFGGFVIRGSAQKTYNPLFLNYLLKSPLIRKQITSKSGGSTRYNIGQGGLSEVVISLPPLEEQKQIAEILSTADEKLEILREKKESFEELKKGLMQKLLTGEVRV